MELGRADIYRRSVPLDEADEWTCEGVTDGDPHHHAATLYQLLTSRAEKAGVRLTEPVVRVEAGNEFRHIVFVTAGVIR